MEIQEIMKVISDAVTDHVDPNLQNSVTDVYIMETENGVQKFDDSVRIKVDLHALLMESITSNLALLSDPNMKDFYSEFYGDKIVFHIHK